MNKVFVMERLGKRNISQSDLAKIMSIDKSQITRLLNGERELKAKEVSILAMALGTTTQNILNNLEG